MSDTGAKPPGAPGQAGADDEELSAWEKAHAAAGAAPEGAPQSPPERAPAPEPRPQPIPAARPVAPITPARTASRPAARRRSWRGWLARVAGWTLAILLVGPIVATVVYKFVPPPVTILMLERMAQGQGLDHRWTPITQMSPALVRAAVASEDANFCEHHGFDFEAMEKALRHDERRPERLRGGSTISQQTAKNVFLWPDRSWVRKGFEAYFTVLIEAIWGKRRIMEVYLNTVEMGPGVYGVEAAAQHDFQVSAAQVTPLQAARIIAVLPSPLKWQSVDPSAYVRRRSGRIDAREGQVRRFGSADCVL